MKMRSWGGVGLLAVVLGVAGVARADQFVKPTAEELAMKSLPGYPGVAAVVLSREEITTDDLHVAQHYDRIKILSEEGKKYANVELKFLSLSEYGDNEYLYTDDKKLGEIAARTIHPDGTVIAFTGKPYKKTMEKGKGVKYQAIVFTLPEVEVGSIIEYRYATHIDQDAVESPDWYVQGDLYLRSAHYEWVPTVDRLVDAKGRPANSISWFARLPAGVKVVRADRLAAGTGSGTVRSYVLDVKDVPPIVEEEFGPPVRSYSYRVLFNYSAFKTPEEYWKEEGRNWSKRVDAFADPNGALRGQTEKVVAGAGTPDEKLRKIYAAVMQMENTRFTRERDKREDKAEGDKVRSAADVLSHGRGSPTQLTELFVGMARAAGMKAYAMAVPDRSIEFFAPTWLSFNQFDDLIAIVSLDGKEICFDPGWRYVPYGHLAWQHTLVEGLRQTEGGTDFGKTGEESYKDNRTTRVANLSMDEKGSVTGTVDVTYTGTAAVEWRHTALRGDEESLRHALQKSMEETLPKTLEVKVVEIGNLTDYEKPLTVSYKVTGMPGTATGKRLVMPADLFLAGASAKFPHEKREQAVYFEYPYAVQDGLKISLSKAMEVEATPAAGKFMLPDRQVYDMSVTPTPTSFITRRTQVQAETIVAAKDYGPLRSFYEQTESKDQETVVLKVTSAQTASGGTEN